METKFTRGIKFLNDLINQTETGSKEYVLQNIDIPKIISYERFSTEKYYRRMAR